MWTSKKILIFGIYDRYNVEIKTRIGMTKDAISKGRELLTQTMDTKLKNKIIRAVVWSAARHCSETWTMRENEIDRLQAFECGYGEEWRRNIGKLRCQMNRYLR